MGRVKVLKKFEELFYIYYFTFCYSKTETALCFEGAQSFPFPQTTGYSCTCLLAFIKMEAGTMAQRGYSF